MGPGKVCRLCLASSKKIVNVFNTDMNLPKKIMGLADVQVVEGDGLPASVCYYCLEKLEISLNFKGQVEKADFILKFNVRQKEEEEKRASVLKNKDSTKHEKDPLALGTIPNENGQNSFLTSPGVWDQQSNVMIKEEVMEVDAHWPPDQPEDTKVYGNKGSSKQPETSPTALHQTLLDQHNEGILKRSDADQHSVVNTNNVQSALSPQKLVCKLVTQGLAIVSSYSISKTAEDTSKITSRENDLNTFKTNTGNETIPNSIVVNNYDDGGDNDDDESGVADCLVCIICDKLFHDGKSLEKHVENHRQNLCLLCFATHQTKESLNIHLKQVHSEFVCLTCQKVFENKIDLQLHWVDHVYERPLSCELCDQAFLKLSSLKQHKLVHTQIETLMCEECGEPFTDELVLKKHQNEQHGTLRLVNCPDCDDTFPDNESLQTHKVSRHPEMYHPCDICKKSFRNKITLISHMRTAHIDKPKQRKRKEYVCEFCGKVYQDCISYMEHKRAHIDAEFTCDVCGEKFDRRRSLAWHKLSHADKAFVCQICDKVFRTKVYLNRHQVIHSGERPFKCTFCDKEYSRKQTLNSHLRVHSKEKLFVCSKCGNGFRYKVSYDQHIVNCNMSKSSNKIEESVKNELCEIEDLIKN